MCCLHFFSEISCLISFYQICQSRRYSLKGNELFLIHLWPLFFVVLMHGNLSYMEFVSNNILCSMCFRSRKNISRKELILIRLNHRRSRQDLVDFVMSFQHHISKHSILNTLRRIPCIFQIWSIATWSKRYVGFAHFHFNVPWNYAMALN